MSTSTPTATRTGRIGPVVRRLRENVENTQPNIDWRAPRFASVLDESTIQLDELIDLTD